MRQGLGAGWHRREPARDATRAAVSAGCPSPSVCVRPPGWRRARALEPKRCASQRNRKFADGGITSGRKSSNWSSRAKPDEAGGMRLDRGGRAPREARLPRGARAPGQKKKKGGRPKGTDSRGGAPDARPKTHALQNDTPRPEPAPAGMLQGLPNAAERRAVGWGKCGGRWRGRRDIDHWPSCGAGARGRRGAARADLLPDTFPPFPVNGCRSGRESGSLRLPGWALSSSGWGRALERAATSTAASPLRGRARAMLEQLVPTSSRLILHLSRLKIAVPTANLVRWRALSSSGWGRALKRAATPSAGSRAAWSLASGEERLVPTSSRIFIHLSRLMVAVPAANLARCGCPAGGC